MRELALHHPDWRRAAGTFVAAIPGVASPGSGEPRDGLDIDVMPQTIDRSVESLETPLGRLEQLPQKVDGLAGQILQLHAEMGSEISAVRKDLAAIRQDLASFRHQMLASFKAIQNRLPPR